MATQGTPLVTPYSPETIEAMDDLLGTDLIQPFEMVSTDVVAGGNFTNRFPTPPTVGSFLVDVENEMPFDGIMAPYVYIGVLYPESPYLEPTIGQIWPR
jgi:hypothetical protein